MRKNARGRDAAHSAAVVCVAGRGENGLAIVRALGRIGVTVYVLGYTGDFNVASRSTYCRQAFSVSRGDSGALLEKLKELAFLHSSKPVLFFDNDEMMAALAGAASELEKLYFFTVPLDRVGGWLGKRKQQELAAEAGLRVPHSWFPTDWGELDDIERHSAARLLAKPVEVSSAGSRPFKIVVSQAGKTLSEVLKTKGLESPAGLIVQEYVEGATENIFVSLAYFGSDDQLSIVATGIKVRQSKTAGGVMAVGQARDVPVVRELTSAFARHLDYRGILGVEFKRTTKEEYFFIEASFRTELFHSMGWKAGANLPVLAHLDLVEHKGNLNSYNSHADHYWINFRTDVKALLLGNQRPGFAAFVKPYLSSKEWAVFASDDLWPWIQSCASLVREFITRWCARLKGRSR